MNRRNFLNFLPIPAFALSWPFAKRAEAKAQLPVAKFDDKGTLINHDELIGGVPFEKTDHDQFGRWAKDWDTVCWRRSRLVFVDRGNAFQHINSSTYKYERIFGEVLLTDFLTYYPDLDRKQKLFLDWKIEGTENSIIAVTPSTFGHANDEEAERCLREAKGL